MAPETFNTSVTRTHTTPIRCLWMSQPYLCSPCTTGTMVKIARLPKVAARTGRRYGSRNRGWKVANEHITAKTDDFIHISMWETRGWCLYQYRICSLQGKVTIETVVKEGYCGSPHKQNHSLEVKLCTKCIHLLAMIYHCVVPIWDVSLRS
jgi:hypothetical protein